MTVEEQQSYDAYRYGCIGDVENGLEKFKPFATYPWHPVGPVPAHEREIQHVDHAAVQERAVTAPLGEQDGCFGRRDRKSVV